MRLRYGYAVALAGLLFAVGCDTTPRVENAPPATDATATTPAPARESNDGLITATIQSKYFASTEVKGRQIDVDTNNGVVVLRGTVDNDAQKQSAEQIAKTVSGVTRIDNQLTVGTAKADPAGTTADRPGGRTPAWITTKVQAQYFLNPELKPWRIDVDTSYSGVVTLTGRIDSEGDRAEAVRIARATEGVTSVNDRLQVDASAAATSGIRDEARDAKAAAERTGDRAADAADRAAEKTKDVAGRTGEAVEDGWITMKIQSKYFVDDDVAARNIDVDTKDGMVTLKGSVGSEGEKQQAIAIAKNTDGVKMVHDSLTVDRNAGNMRRDTSPSGTTGVKVDDAWITMKVQSKYFIHDEIKSRTVDVDTKNGVVTLNGTVTSDTAKQAAEILARDTDGVTRVVNNLKVDPGRG